MPTYEKTCFEPGQTEATGILVVNLGTPNAPTPAAVRQFLKEFLSDPRVVEYPRLLWWLILNLVILRIRPSRSAEAYRKVWTDEGSPLLIYSKAITDKLSDSDTLRANGSVHVELAMTYGDPSIDDAIDKLLAKGVRRILTLPLYPQYSGTTTAAIYDAVVRKIGKLRWLPETRFISSYHDAPAYIMALAANIREYWTEHGRGEKLLISFHGIPESLVTSGDPYQCHCHETGRLLVTNGCSHFNHVSGASNGCNRILMKWFDCLQNKAYAPLMLYALASQQTASKRLKKSRCRMPSFSQRREVNL
jgi:ferrochelatase